MRVVLFFIGFGVGLVVGGAVVSGSSRLDDISVDEVAQILDKEGFTVTRGRTPTGATYLGALMGKSGFQVNFFDCKEDKFCEGLEFVLGFDNVKGASVERMNEWNRKTKLSKAYLQSGDPVIEMNIPLEGGVKKQYIENYVATWRSQVGHFVNYLNGAPL